MKTKFASLAGVAVFAFHAGAVQIGEVVVRQQWPWKTQVNVDFLAAGTTGAVSQVTLTAYRGGMFLGNVPLPKCFGDVSFTTDGPKRVSFDPADVDFIAAQGPMLDFSIDVSVADVPPDDALYMVFDLRKTPGGSGQLQYVTEEALTNGLWGAWERDYWGEDLARTVIWTGVTNDPAYKTTHLVMRRIPAGSFPMGNPSDSPQNITISKPYYMGVFEFTLGQRAMLANAATNIADDVAFRFPDSDRRWYYTSFPLALHGPNSADYKWPAGREVGDNSICGKLRARTNMGFMLPTEAQWEKAARGGSTGLYYASNSTEEDSSLAAQLAWNRSSISGTRSAHEVGLKKPNAYGLYDVIGNVQEFVLDWYVENWTAPDPTDPPGPTEADTAAAGLNSQRVVKGGNYDGTAGNGCHIRAYKNSTTGSSANTGYRVYCPAP